MRVLHLILTLERAGAQEVLRSLVTQQAAMGVESVVATFVDGEIRHDLEAAGIPVEVLGPRRFGIERPLRFREELADFGRRLRTLIGERRIDLVQTHLLHTLDFLALALPVPVIWTVHNVDYLPAGGSAWGRLKREVHRRLYRRNRERFAAIVATAETMRTEVERGIGASRRLVTISNSVELGTRAQPEHRPKVRRALGLDEDAALLLTVGRLTDQKGQLHLVRAMRSVVEAHPRARLLIAGTGELESALRAEVGRLGLEDHVSLLGLRRDVDQLLRAADLFVLPSLWEGLSIALLEAMAAGLPVVATRVSGTDQVLRHRESGLVVEPRDEDALAEALQAVLDDPELGRALGTRARATVEEEHSAERAARAYLELYKEVLA